MTWDAKYVAFVAIVPVEEADQVQLSERSVNCSQGTDLPTTDIFEDLARAALELWHEKVSK